MITTPQEYNEKLYLIQDTNKPSIAILLPSDEKIYNVDLATRSIDAPKFLSVEKDHYAETIYFLVDRYYDNIDLSQTTCIVQYINAKDEGRIYAVPFMDITTYEGKILLPWCIEGEATKAAGRIKFALKFYTTFKDQEGNILFDFNCNTTFANSKILNGLHVEKQSEEYNYLASQVEEALARIDVATKLDIEWLYI